MDSKPPSPLPAICHNTLLFGHADNVCLLNRNRRHNSVESITTCKQIQPTWADGRRVHDALRQYVPRTYHSSIHVHGVVTNRSTPLHIVLANIAIYLHGFRKMVNNNVSDMHIVGPIAPKTTKWTNAIIVIGRIVCRGQGFIGLTFSPPRNF